MFYFLANLTYVNISVCNFFRQNPTSSYFIPYAEHFIFYAKKTLTCNNKNIKSYRCVVKQLLNSFGYVNKSLICTYICVTSTTICIYTRYLYMYMWCVHMYVYRCWYRMREISDACVHVVIVKTCDPLMTRT